MLQDFLSFVEKHHLSKSQKTTLIGVSGGRDSVILCELYQQAKMPFAMAHCNFNLRAEASDADEVFVRNLALKYKVECFVKSCDTKAYAEQNGISIQMAARDLRFAWFEELMQQNDFDFYATAHHKDDNIETHLINQIRGTGLAGLHGIQPKNKKLIHPLLFATRAEIDSFILQNHLDYREDKSNAATKYLRNKVRHKLIPVYKDINPDYQHIFQQNINRFAETEQMLTYFVQQFRQQHSHLKGEELFLEAAPFKSFAFGAVLSFEIIKEYGFSYDQCQQLLAADKSKSGLMMYSAAYELLQDRGQYIIRPKSQETPNLVYEIGRGETALQQPIPLRLALKTEWTLNKSEKTAQLDASKLTYPLQLRKWQQGDYFHPLGMKGKKKLLSDFFIDKKLSRFEKEKLWLLCSNKKIVWVMGLRIDEGFKITKASKQILEIEIL